MRRCMVKVQIKAKIKAKIKVQAQDQIKVQVLPLRALRFFTKETKSLDWFRWFKV